MGAFFMDKRVKFSCKLKLSIVRSVMAGDHSCLTAARKIGSHKSTVQRWLIVYQQQGSKGFQLRNGSYTGPFKVQVVRYLLAKGLSLPQTAAFFAIPNHVIVHRWLKIYECYGADGLLRSGRSRKKTLMPKKKDTAKKGSSTDQSAEKLAALQKEVEYLRAENAFLKKLDALIQQEKAAKAQSKQRTSSRN
jgi:transposase